MVLAISKHLMDGVAITEAARRAGIQLALTAPERALESLRSESPALVLLDLAEPAALALLEAGELKRVRTIGYYPHVDGSLRERALRAGVSRALPRSAFFGRLADWLLPGETERLPEAGGGC